MNPPAWEWSAEEVRRIGHEAVELIAGHLAGIRERPVTQPYPLPPPGFGDTGLPVEAVLAEFAERIAPYPFGNGHPRFAAWVNSPPHPIGVFAEALAAAMNPSVAGGDHAAVHIEREVVRLFAGLAGFPVSSTGLLVSGGSMATLTALAAARHRAAERAGIDLRAEGLQSLRGRRFVFYLGAEGHGSARKAVEMLGIGSDNIRVVPSGEGYRMRPDALRESIAADLAAGCLPMAVMASVGTVNTGAIDPIPEIAQVCAEFGVWLHVDGAYGGPAVLLLDGYGPVRQALSAADSLALDPHKWLYVPVDAGLILVKDGDLARRTFSLVPPYLRTEGGPVWFSEYGFDQTRPFRALKVWAQLRHLGLDGYRRLIARDIAVAGHLASLVEAAPDLELLARGLSVVCFRCRPDDSRDPSDLDELNRAVLARLQRGGRAFLAGTTVDGVAALRACVVNPRMGDADAAAIIAEVRTILSLSR